MVHLFSTVPSDLKSAVILDKLFREKKNYF
jgi:hypothetical protein